MFAQGQILHYDIVKGSKTIGNVSTSRTFEGSRKSIVVDVKVEFRLLFSFTLDFLLEEQFEGGVLVGGSSINKLNGSTQKESSVEKRKENYRLVIGGTPNRVQRDTITYSISEIYFREPESGEEAFSQHFGQFLKFEKVKPHTYKMVSPDGENYYTYENGVCIKVRVVRDYANYSLIIKPESYAQVKQLSDSTRIK